MHLTNSSQKPSTYDSDYNADLLHPISRKLNRDLIHVPDKLPFYGIDIWNHYEVSWLNEKGKPIVAIAELSYPCDSTHIIESKSMKLYFNSLNNTKIKNTHVLTQLIQSDIEQCIGSPVSINIIPLNQASATTVHPHFQGVCIDNIDIDCSCYTLTPTYLITEAESTAEILFSHLVKSNCLVTQQPDWGSVQITYEGNKINHAGLLRYLVSYRHCNEFSETCIERIFMDIMRYCQPSELTVYGRFTRRGGIDINPYRSTQKTRITDIQNIRLNRQ